MSGLVGISSPYKAFNHQLKTFFRECDKTFQDMMCFKFMLSAYKVLKSMNKKLPQKYWHELVMVPHGDSLRNKSDASFFAPDFVAPTIYANMIDAIKNKWLTLDEETKATVFEHMSCLVQLNDLCVEYRKMKKMPPIESLPDDAVEQDE